MDYKVDIKTNADLAGAKATADALNNIKKAVDGVTTAEKKRYENAQKERATYVAIAKEQLHVVPAAKAATPGVISTAAKAAAASAAAYISLSSAVNFAQKSLSSYVETEQVLLSLNSALQQRGIYTDEYAKSLRKMADALAEATGIDDEKWLSVISTLTKFGATGKNIDLAVKATKNLAGSLGTDIGSAADIVGRAMQGNTRGLSQWIKDIDKLKDKTEILNKIAERFAYGAGQIEQGSKGLGGQFKAYARAMEDFGKGLVEFDKRYLIFGKLNELSTKTWKWLASLLPEVTVEQVKVNKATDDFSGNADSATDSAKEYKDILKELKDEASRLQDALSEVNSEIEQQLQHEEKMASIGKEQQMASLDLEKAQRARGPVWGRDRRGRPVLMRAGAMSDAEYETRKGQIEQSYLSGQAGRNIAAQEAQISNIQASYNYARRLGDVDAMQKYGQQLAIARTGLGYRAQEYGAQFGAEGTKMAAGMVGLNQSFGQFTMPVMQAIADLNRKYNSAAEQMRQLASQVKNSR